jgi:hypothetical protein
MIFQEIQKKYRTILDNITPGNVVLMAKNILSLPIKSDDCLKRVVELLFQKVYIKNAMLLIFVKHIILRPVK